MITSETACLLLHFLPKIGVIRAQRLIRHFKAPEKIFSAETKALLSVDGMGLKQVSALQQWEAYLPRVRAEQKFMENEGIRAILPIHEEYPMRLLHCPDAPVVLFCKGTSPFANPKVVSIVGTRTPTNYGRACTQALLEHLAPYSPTIVSGFAYGIDIWAHRLALDHQLSAVACLAHGLDRTYPKTHQSFVPETLEQGCLVSDFSSQALFDRYNFLQRNRIIAGLSDLTVVVESDLRGGSMNTAQYAWEYDRDLWVFPGRIGDRKSRGCLHLVQANKAQLISDLDIFIAQLGWEEKSSQGGTQKRLPLDLNAREIQIWETLEAQGKMHLDALAFHLRMEIRQLSAVLFELEMKSCIRALPGKFFEAL